MRELTYALKLKMGLHARPSALLADRVRYHDCEVKVYFEDKVADATKITELMALGTKQGSEVRVTMEGPEEDTVFAELQKVFQENL